MQSALLPAMPLLAPSLGNERRAALPPAKQGFVGGREAHSGARHGVTGSRPSLMHFTPWPMQKASDPALPLSGFSLQPRQNNVLPGVGRKRAFFVIALPDQAQAGTSVSCSRRRLGREIEVTASRHRHLFDQAQAGISVSCSRQRLGREIEMTALRHSPPPAQACSGFSLLQSEQGSGWRREKRAPQKETPEDVCMPTQKNKKAKPLKQENPALRIRETAQRFCESSEPPPVGPQPSPQACVGYRALPLPSGAQCQQGWRRSRLDLSL